MQLVARSARYSMWELIAWHCVSLAAGIEENSANSKEELVQEKKKELEKRLRDVSGQLNHNKKPPEKGTCVSELTLCNRLPNGLE